MDKKKGGGTKLITMLALVIINQVVILSAQGNPAVDQLNEAIVYYFSFDYDSLEPDMSAAKFGIKTEGEPQFQRGKYGKALLIGNGKGRNVVATYFSEEQFFSPDGGSLCYWVCPVRWISKQESTQRAYLLFITLYGVKGSIIIERMGFCANPPRTDRLITGYFNFNDLKSTTYGRVDTSAWDEGRWHLIVMTYDTKGFSISVDGDTLARTELSRPLTKEDFYSEGKKKRFALGAAVMGDANTDREGTLIDELILFKRQLTQGEIEKIYKTSGQ